MKYEIEIEGLPEGWKPVKLKVGTHGNVAQEIHYVESVLIIEKIQPRRIVLEETEEFHEDEDTNAEHTQFFPLYQMVS